MLCVVCATTMIVIGVDIGAQDKCAYHIIS
jgi:hypothetical protein